MLVYEVLQARRDIFLGRTKELLNFGAQLHQIFIGTVYDDMLFILNSMPVTFVANSELEVLQATLDKLTKQFCVNAVMQGCSYSCTCACKQ
jgi:hypothetical protein